MKTYFKYEGIIKSKEAAEAIAAPSGLGPFCGFGSATINGNRLTVSPQGVSGSKYANVRPYHGKVHGKSFRRWGIT